MDQNWFENEEFWQDFYPYMFDEKRFHIASLEVTKILAISLFQGKDILDLCCGPARHATILAQRGYRVTGVDRSQFLLSKAKERALAEAVELELVHEDMLNFHRPESFDLVLNLFTSFGYFADKDDDVRVLKNIHNSLRKNGTLLIDVVAKEVVAKSLRATTSEMQADGTLLVERHEIRDNWTRIRNEWILIRDGTTKHYHFEHTIYSGQELMDRLLEAGFANVELFGDLEGSPFGANAKRLVAVARKE
jgi:SAM-dependent methyltransferase